MDVQIVYVIVGNMDSLYGAMLRLSIRSLRYHHPDAQVKIITDSETYAELVSRQSRFLEEGFVIIDVPEEMTIMQRSRFLKTSVRQHIAGDFLFVDTDTIIAAPLDELDCITDDVSLVIDRHMDYHVDHPYVLGLFRKAGFASDPGLPYFNSGVMLVRDTPIAHRLYQTWHSYWLKSQFNGVPMDQPALCAANHDLGYIIHELPARFNTMTATPLGFCSYLPQACLIHYFNENHFPLRQHVLAAIRHDDAVVGWRKLLIRYPRTIGVSVFSMGDMDILRHGMRLHPLSQGGLSWGRWLWVIWLWVTSKVVSLFIR